MLAILEKIPYRGKYPSAGEMLIREGFAGVPRQVEKDILYAEAIDIIWPLKNMTPANFQAHADTLLLLAAQECARYKGAQYKFARLEVTLGRLKKGRDLKDKVTFQASMHHDGETMVYGPGYDTPGKEFLKDKIDDVLQLTKRYPGKLNKQTPYKVTHLVISIRQRREIPEWLKQVKTKEEAHKKWNELFALNEQKQKEPVNNG